MSAGICKTCDAEFDRPHRRGRPPVECDNCRSVPRPTKKPDVRKTLTAIERVERLEMNLKASGLHISQHRE